MSSISLEHSRINYNGYQWEVEELLNADPFDPRLIPRNTGIHCISLSNRVDCYCIVDAQDYSFLNQWLWCHTFGSGELDDIIKAPKGTDKIYARRSVRTKGFTKSGRPRYGNEWLHRVVCERANGPAPSIYHVADHLNGDSLDCRRHNLRWATLSENNRNKFGTAWLQMRLEL